MGEKFDIYSMITDRIVAELEKGQIPWHKPWVGTGGCIAHTTGRPYSVLNQLMLSKPGEYLTFKQINAEGGKVKKGEKANVVVFWKPWVTTGTNKEGEEVKKTIFLLRYYNVFHIDQTEGIKPKYDKKPPKHAEPDAEAEAIIADYLKRTGIRMYREKGDRAYYSPMMDEIHVPLMEQFPDTAEFYSTAFHEMTHSTGHEFRLNRLSKDAHFGNEDYSKEELVAEIGAASLNMQCGLENKDSFRNSTAYIQSWIRALKDDKKLITSASSKAEKAVKYILNEQDNQEEMKEEE